MKNLVIVESPTKARTLGQFLGADYQITASMGHVRDLPRGEFGVDVEHDFEPKYVIPKEKIKTVNSLTREAAGADHLWLATDPDREGEAIAWNLLEVIREKSPSFAKATEGKEIKNQKYGRVVFHEITREAIMEAFRHPRKLDEDLVQAQQARRVLDRLVGYKLSPLLWKKVKSGLSAGRVQSVALRLVVDREREIEAFVPVEYWEIKVKVKVKTEEFIVALIKIDGAKAEIKNKEQAQKVVGDLEKSAYKVLEVATRDAKKYPSPPFTTSTLQQSAATKLGFTPKRTMRVAQDLYEQGLITYMRTDSVNLAEKALGAARAYIEKNFGKNYLPVAPRRYKVKSKLAQEAHEAVRPTDITVNPSTDSASSLQASSGQAAQFTGNDHRKLYDLIWKRMVACQMAEAVVAETSIDVEARGPVGSFLPASARSAADGSVLTDSVSADLRAVGNPSTAATPRTFLLRANGQQVKFDGWYKVYGKPPVVEQVLPKLVKDEDLSLVKVDSEQKFTEPPARFTEATLIKELEKHDIGRPSTYAPTISTLYERVYIEKLENRKIGPTPIGKTAVDFLVKYFPEIVDLKFTAQMENDLDEIAQGKREPKEELARFWEPFAKKIDEVALVAQKVKVEVLQTDQKCEKCGRPMVVRYGRFGKFLACSGFPECKNTKTLAEPTGLTCPADSGKIVVKKTKRGKTFWGCENWPQCKWASWTKPAITENTEKKHEGTEESARKSNEEKDS